MGVTKKKVKKRKKMVLGAVISLSALLAIYLGMTVYFSNHFYFGSAINCVSVSGKTVEEADKQMAAELQSYTLNIKERGGKTEKIKASDINLKYNSDGGFKSFKDKQNPFAWVSAFVNRKDVNMTEDVSYNKQLLQEQIDKLSCLQSSNIVEPKNASFKYTDNSYAIVDEVQGNKLNKDALVNKITDAVTKGETTIDLDAADCYVKPEYTSKSQKTIDTQKLLNKYVSSNVTYTFGSNKEVLDGSTINKWITVDNNLEVTIDEKQVNGYVNTLSSNYNTVGKKRNFLTSSGNTINIGGGDYGWSINKTKEAQNLITAIKDGKTVTKEPTYSATASSHGSNDIGNTYVEIDLSKQHLWFYKNGSLVVQGDVVTGNMSNNNSTPGGIYKLKYKQKDATLTGQDYASPVNYWMPFNGNIGIHDASWRSVFGGEIYKTNGSHGCVNSPYDLAKTIFENIQPGTPVVCYY